MRDYPPWFDGPRDASTATPDVHALPVNAHGHFLTRSCPCSPDIEFAGARWFVIHAGALPIAQEAQQ